MEVHQESPAPGPADHVRQVLPDLLLPGDPPIYVTATGRVMWGQAAVIVSAARPGTEPDLSFGFEFPAEADRAEVLAAVAARLQDALADLLGTRRPDCRAAGHDHVLSPTVRQDTAVWSCPKGGYQVEVTRYPDGSP
ncbi:MAG TPA: hypothetical protein VFX70_13345 [Mycobacteriales bacterium]|nr:hypothetical protein [Mycobacteriales bacterium]